MIRLEGCRNLGRIWQANKRADMRFKVASQAPRFLVSSTGQQLWLCHGSSIRQCPIAPTEKELLLSPPERDERLVELQHLGVRQHGLLHVRPSDGPHLCRVQKLLDGGELLDELVGRVGAKLGNVVREAPDGVRLIAQKTA